MYHIALLLLSLVAGIQGIPNLNPPSGNYSPVHNVLQVLPVDQVQQIEKKHLKNDAGFKAAVLYLQSAEWIQLVNNVIKSPEFKNFAEMTQKYKLNITQTIKCMRTHIESLKVVPSKIISKPNLEPFITDVQKVIPIMEIAKVLNSDNPELKRVREEIGTIENQKIAESLHNLQEMVKMRQILKGMNFDVEPFLALLYTFLGWIH